VWIASRSLSAGAHSRDPLARNDAETHLRDLAARYARGLPKIVSPFENEGAGNAGRAMRPQPGTPKQNKRTSEVTTVTPKNARHSPRKGVYERKNLSTINGFRCLDPPLCPDPPFAIMISKKRPSQRESGWLGDATPARPRLLCAVATLSPNLKTFQA